MRIAIVIERYDPQGGGAERSTAQIAEELVRRHHHVTIIAASAGAESVPGMGLVTVGPGQGWLNARRLRQFARRAITTIRDGRFDTSLSVTTAVPAAVVQPRGGTVRETLERNIAARATPLKRRLKRLAVALSAKHRTQLRLERRVMADHGVRRFAAISQYVARQLRDHYRIDDTRIDVIPNAAAMGRLTAEQRRERRSCVRQAFGIPADTTVYLFVAMNPWLKGITPLLAAARLLKQRRRDFVLMLAGGIWYEYQRTIAQYGIRNRVRFVGKTDQTESLYCAADVTVHPTFYDPSSKVVIESLMMGVPAVTTRYNGASEWLLDDQGAARGRVLDDPNDVPALADAMAELAEPSILANCRDATNGLADQLSMHRHVDRLEALLTTTAT